MKVATREDFENFMRDVKNAVNDDNIAVISYIDFKDYSEFLNELQDYLKTNSKDLWQIHTDMGLEIEKV